MANFNKSFNFKNGVQVDNDNFIVNANGLVGIGTTIPKEYLLNVYGDSRFSGIVTTANLYSDVSNVGFVTAGNVFSAGVVTATTFYGSAAGLTGIYAIAVDGWHITSGTISTTAKVGIATTSASGDLQIGIAVTINSNGNATYSGIITALGFSGIGSNITQLNANNISLGTLSNSRLPSDINLSGIITGYSFSGFGTNLTGINASNISSGTLSNSRLPSNISVSGIVTAASFDGIGSNITQINASNISSGTLSNSRLPSSVNVSGIVTASGGFVGNLTGTASTAQSLSGNPSISVTNLNVSGIATVNTSLNVGGNAFTALNSGRIGIGTTNPTSDIQIRKSSGSLLEVISDTGNVRISIGQSAQSVGVSKSTAVLRFGDVDSTFDIINNDIGNINHYLHAGEPGIGTGRFDWIYGQGNIELMSLTYGGKLGLGKTNPDETLHVVGTSTVTGNAYFGSDVTISGNLNITGGSITLPPVFQGNVYTITGVSTFSNATFNDVGISSILTVSDRLGINTTNPKPNVRLDVTDGEATFGTVGVGTTANQATFRVFGGSVLESVAIGNTVVDDGSGLGVYGGTTTLSSNTVSGINSSVVIFDSTVSVGVGTTSYRSSLDFGDVGKDVFGGIGAFMIVPRLTNAQRAGLITSPGAFIFNLDDLKFQGYTGIAWTDFH